VGIFFLGGIEMDQVFERSARFEHRFWLQILGDHSRFIFEALAPIQKVEIEQAANFINIFDTLLEQAKSSPLTQLADQVEAEVLKLREFKLELIRQHLVGKIKIHLSPTFINHMVNELEEYVRILNHLKEGRVPPVYHELHHHLLWLLDAAGHSDAIYSNLDGVEKKLREKSKAFKKDFEGFYLKAVELAGYLRTNLTSFPALKKMTNDAQLEIKLFQNFLTELEELELSNQALGTFAPLMADHMYREECYYLMKLAESADIEPPNCDPAKPRLKE
jgi:predicted nucleotide-binding protein (sugar kinase/HSP70/actin superfamily)